MGVAGSKSPNVVLPGQPATAVVFLQQQVTGSDRRGDGEPGPDKAVQPVTIMADQVSSPGSDPLSQPNSVSSLSPDNGSGGGGGPGSKGASPGFSKLEAWQRMQQSLQHPSPSSKGGRDEVGGPPSRQPPNMFMHYPTPHKDGKANSTDKEKALSSHYLAPTLTDSKLSSGKQFPSTSESQQESTSEPQSPWSMPFFPQPSPDGGFPKDLFGSMMPGTPPDMLSMLPELFMGSMGSPGGAGMGFMPPVTKSAMVFPEVDIREEKLTAEHKRKLEKMMEVVYKWHHDICHFTRARIKMLKKKFYNIIEEDTEFIHDCSNCTPPPDFPVGEVPPRELPLNGEVSDGTMWQFFAGKMTGLITRIVTIAKYIPGFKNLEREDQITLIKSGLFEVASIRFTTVVDIQRQMIHYWTTGDSFKLENARKSPLGNIVDLIFDFASRFNKLNLYDTEVALLNSVIITAADRPGLKNKEQVTLLQADLLRALQLEMSKNHPDDLGLFARLLTTLPKLRELGPEHTRRLMELRLSNINFAKFPPLYSECFDLEEEGGGGGGGSGSGAGGGADNH